MKKLFLGGIFSAVVLLTTACGPQSTAPTPTASTVTTTMLPTTTTVSVTTTAETTTVTTAAATTVTTTTKKTVKRTASASNTGTTSPTTARTLPAFAYASNEIQSGIRLLLQKTEYAVDESVSITIENNTDEPIYFFDRFDILIPDGNGGWLVDRGPFRFERETIPPNTAYRSGINLSSYALEAGKTYKVIAMIDDRWVGADFTALESKNPTTATSLTVPDSFREEDFRTDISLQLDQPSYHAQGTMKVVIDNTTNENIQFDTNYTILKQGDSGEWEALYPLKHDNTQIYLPSGKRYHSTVSLKPYRFSDVPLEEGQPYRLVWFVENKWVAADFTVVPVS